MGNSVNGTGREPPAKYITYDLINEAFEDGYLKGRADAKSAISTASERIIRLETELRDCRNELCLRCGDYHRKHLGACDGCRWEKI